MDETKSLLAAAVTRLAEAEAEYTQRLEERDALIRRSREQGMSWIDINLSTGLSTAAVTRVLEAEPA